MPTKVLILGGTGMVGAMLTDYLARDDELEITATTRREELIDLYRQKLGDVRWLVFDTATEEFYQKFDLINEHEWVINAISVGKPLIHEDNAFESNGQSG